MRRVERSYGAHARSSAVSERTANCPNCGAEITFRWSGAVQTTCPACGSMLVRHDLDLDASRQRRRRARVDVAHSTRHRGLIQGQGFVVVGRIVYEYERGHWSEWHIRLCDGTSAWLSDAQTEYAVTRQVDISGCCPARPRVTPGKSVALAGAQYTRRCRHARPVLGRRRRAAIRVLGQAARRVHRPQRPRTAAAINSRRSTTATPSRCSSSASTSHSRPAPHESPRRASAESARAGDGRKRAQLSTVRRRHRDPSRSSSRRRRVPVVHGDTRCATIRISPSCRRPRIE